MSLTPPPKYMYMYKSRLPYTMHARVIISQAIYHEMLSHRICLPGLGINITRYWLPVYLVPSLAPRLLGSRPTRFKKCMNLVQVAVNSTSFYGVCTDYVRMLFPMTKGTPPDMEAQGRN